MIKTPVRYVKADQIIRDVQGIAILSVISERSDYRHGQQIADALNDQAELASAVEVIRHYADQCDECTWPKWHHEGRKDTPCMTYKPNLADKWLKAHDAEGK